VHLLKLEASPASDPRSGWQETIVQQRGDIERILADSPSLWLTIPAVIDKELGRARRIAMLALAGHGEQARTDPCGLRYTAEQVLGDWFPDEA
jgi:hypothetical protein